MAIIKCKMCGGDIELSEDRTYGTCDSCGSIVTLPKIDDEQRAAAFNRGNHFRRMGEFDKALAVYERIVQEDDTDAEAHWCCALCRFGIEYVEDPATREYLPTCHRASFDSFLEDVDYLAALERSDGVTRRQYQKEAEKIAEVQRGILATSQNEKPFDVFICYKESDDNGDRTRDSMLAQDICYQLTEQGMRVFFSRITLEDKAGTQYEPYIFAALNSAKVMIVVGTRPEYMNAVWVKNEWSRFLALMRHDRTKLLIPCYRDMDPYDLPEQLSVLQAYDMSKIGFIQDLIRGVMKVLGRDKKPAPTAETVVVKQSESGGSRDILLKRGNMALEDENWDDANSYFERALDIDVECAHAYMGKFLAAQHCKSLESFFQNYLEQFTHVGMSDATAINMDYTRMNAVVAKAIFPENVWCDLSLAFDLTAFKNKLQEFFISINRTYPSRLYECEQLAEQGKAIFNSDKLLNRALQFAKGAYREELHRSIARFNADLDTQIEVIRQEDERSSVLVREEYARQLDIAERRVKDERQRVLEPFYTKASKYKKSSDIARVNSAEKKFRALAALNYKDSAEKAKECRRKVEQIEKEKRRKKVITISLVIIIALAMILLYFLSTRILPDYHYKKGETLLGQKNYAAAIESFQAAGDYQDAQQRAKIIPFMECYDIGETLLAAGQYDAAIQQFTAAGSHSDAPTRIQECYYAKGEALLAESDFDGAIAAFNQAGDYSDAKERGLACYYAKGEALLAENNLNEAAEAFKQAGNYSDAPTRMQACYYDKGEALRASGNYDSAVEAFLLAGNYSGAPTQVLRTYYSKGEALLAQSNFDGAAEAFQKAGNYSDAVTQMQKAYYSKGETLLAAGDDEGAAAAFSLAGNYSDASTRMQKEYYNRGEALLAAGDDEGAAAAFSLAGNYSDASTRMQKEYYNRGEALLAAGDDEGAAAAFSLAGNYSDASTRILECYYAKGEALVTAGDNDGAITAFSLAGNYSDAPTRIQECYYAKGEALATAGDNDGAITAFSLAGNYSDASTRILECYYVKGETLLAAGDDDGAAAAFKQAGNYSDAPTRMQKEYYSRGEAMLAAGDDEGAAAAFKQAGNYSDASTRMQKEYYSRGETQLAAGKKSSAAIAFGQAGNYKDAHQRSMLLWSEIAVRNTIAGGDEYSIGLKADGTVVAARNYNFGTDCDVSNWQNIVAVDAGNGNTIGLRADGTVVATGWNSHGECDVSGWRNIVAIAAGDSHTIGLKADGTVVAAGSNSIGKCRVSEWRDIVAVAAGLNHTIGLKADGTVVAAGGTGVDGECDVSSWRDIIAIAAGWYLTVGLKADGTVIAIGSDKSDVSGWRNIVAIAAKRDLVIGLKADGTVVAAKRYNSGKECNVSGWRNIVAIAAGDSHTIGLRANGTVVATGKNDDGQCNVSDWRNIKLP